MKINSISITTSQSWEKDKYGDYKASISVGTENAYESNINIGLSAEQLSIIVPIIAQAVAQNMAEAIKQFNESVQAVLAPPIEQFAITTEVG